MHVAAPPMAAAVAPAAAFEIAAVLLAIAVIVVAARLAGILFARIGQPRVVGEIAAGIALGPSVLGAALPAVTDHLFGDIRPTLGVIANLGLVLFMFLVGLEFDASLVRGQGRTMASIFAGSLLTPFALGVGAGLVTHSTVDPGTGLLGYCLFLGAAMCITAFPVLARILAERGLSGSPLGVLALGCAALEDVCAWLILAVVVAVVKADGAAAFLGTFGLTAGFALVMLFAVRPAMAWVLRRSPRGDAGVTAGVLSLILAGVLVSAWATEQIGIHAIFGAFAFGAVLPRDARLVEDVSLRLEDVVVLLFLPVFFASAGLTTEIGAVDTGPLVLCGLLILAAAVIGKFVPVFAAARLNGLPPRDAATLGFLMNTRGLTELVIISVGREIGVVNAPMFAILVFMALATTMMTSPAIDAVRRRAEPVFRPSQAGLAPGEGPRRVLAALDGSPGDGRLAELAARLAEPTGASLVLARVLPTPERLSRRTTAYDAGIARAGARQAAEVLAGGYREQGYRVEVLAETATDPGLELCRAVERTGADLVLIGAHRSLLGTDVLGGTVGTVLTRCPADTAVLIDRDGGALAFPRGGTVLVPYGGGPHERAAVRLAEKLAATSGAPLAVLAEDPVAAGDLLAAGVPEAAVRVAGDAPRDDLAAELARAGVLVIGAGRDWAHDGGIGRSRARLVSGAVLPVLVVREGAAGGARDVEEWLRRTRRDQRTDWLATRTGTAPQGA
ncbi:MAG: cation:proton antiporter [Thermoleophilia bacterium]|nr:cation:proton antiporter [Thermoleophilia bacterium]